jgi:hypothetical protein
MDIFVRTFMNEQEYFHVDLNMTIFDFKLLIQDYFNISVNDQIIYVSEDDNIILVPDYIENVRDFFMNGQHVYIHVNFHLENVDNVDADNDIIEPAG